MSTVQLAARGVQDTFFINNEMGVSPFRTRYNMHTNFAHSPKRLQIIGRIQPGSTSTIPITSYGDLINALWFEGSSLNTRLPGTTFELFIGGQLVDSQTWEYINDIWQPYMADTWTKATAINNAIAHADSNFLPMHFFFCEHDQFLPICALAYHEVEIKVTWGPSVGTDEIKAYANYIFLDVQERQLMIHTEHTIPITQVQKITNLDMANFNHPVKAIFFGKENDPLVPYTFSSASIYLNNNLLVEEMSPTYFHTVQSYYHTKFAVLNFDEDGGSPLYTNFFMYSFADNLTDYVSKGSCNMSRIDSAILKVSGAQPTIIYAVNQNIYIIIIILY